MKKKINHLFRDPLVLTGFILLIVSATAFGISGYLARESAYFSSFCINYLCSCSFTLFMVIRYFRNHKKAKERQSTEQFALLLSIWFVSAFGLNREMNVFDDSVTWLSICIILSVVVLLLAVHERQLPFSIRYLVFLALGAGLLLFIYYSIYLIPLYAISIPAAFAIGLSLHSFVPLGLTILTIMVIKKAYSRCPKLLYLAIIGFVLPAVGGIVFVVKWGQRVKEINQVINQNTLNDGKLPNWVAVSQHIENTPLTAKIMKAGLMFHEVSEAGNFFFEGIPSTSFDVRMQHDPLVVLGTLFYPRSNLDEKEKINILKAIYHSRHQAQERLRNGDHLQTVSVISNLKLYPEYRMAYTEKTLMIKNDSERSWDQEAIYTFHLTEGSVVSSLSLWINGKEEQSRLTTKAKADSAYKTIVGVQQRDPAVVHWQEGNTVSVRIFPCNRQENRMFRIGITSPLQKTGNRLIYHNAFFDGPDASQALESLKLSFSQKAIHLKLPLHFTEGTGGFYSAAENYIPEWEISCDAPELASTQFSFGGSAYEVKDYKPRSEHFKPDAIYLDVNSSWSKDEFDQVCQLTKKYPVFIFDEELIALKSEDADAWFHKLQQKNFSLFPLNLVKDAEKALIITKGTASCPNLNDLEGSVFARDLKAFLKKPKQVRLYNLGTELTPYLRTLKELRVFNAVQGDITLLGKYLDQEQFVQNPEHEKTVSIDVSAVIIQKTNDAVQNKQAPDHLLRLFAYNNIMKDVSARYFDKNEVQPVTINQANEAYIVSPVSSMIVLETLEDYRKFNIEANKNSLKNASMKSSGAVPEPEEWMLIIVAMGLVSYTFFKSKKRAIHV